MAPIDRDISRILETLDIVDWEGEVNTNMRWTAVEALEDGKVLYFPRLAFPLSQQERRFLSADVADARAKNISFDPATGTLKHAHAEEPQQAEIARMMRRYADAATRLLRTLVPQYAGAIEIGRTSFRPAEIKGRRLSPRKDDTRLHVDAFPSTPTGGKRILRLFTNVNPDGFGRHWRLGAPFEEVAEAFLGRVPEQWPGSAWMLNAVRATKSRRTPYDHLMLNIHDIMKADDIYQQTVLQSEFRFPPGSTWIVYTDKVSHAAMGGQHLFEQTFYLPVAAMVDSAKAPLRILERLAGRTLA